MPGSDLLDSRHGHRGKRLGALLLALLVVPAAAGAWSATGGGTSAAAAASMPTGSTPGAVAVLTTVTVTWPAVSVGGSGVAGYVVKRYETLSGSLSTIGGSCTGIVAATTCSDSGVPLGAWRYSVTPVHHAWTGTESARSISVAVTL